MKSLLVRLLILVHDQHLRVFAADLLPVVAEGDDLAGLGGLGDVGVAVDEVVSAGILGEEGQHRAGALGPGGHVVLFQDRVAAPVHDRVEVQVEDRFLAGGEPGGDHLGVQGGQERPLVVVGQPVGVAGERGFLRQDGQPGQQRRGRVRDQQVIDVGDPAGGGELERQQRQHPGDGGDDPRAGVARGGDQGGQVQGDQVGDDQQQPGHAGVRPGGPVIEVDHRGRGQGGVAAGRVRRGAGLGLRVAQQPAEAFLGEDLPDRCAVERGALGGQPGGDLVGGQALAAQRDHPAAGAVLGGGHAGQRAGPPGRGEQLQLPGPVVADQVDHRPAGVAEPGPGLGIGQALGEVGAQRLVAALVHLRRRGERLRALPLLRSGCHMHFLPDVQLIRNAEGTARNLPVASRLSLSVAE